ncbi:MAG: hypothetical protein IJX92_03540 [Clostridia bacterium]|nr:hypothetical protein [Clostridia bacterium]
MKKNFDENMIVKKGVTRPGIKYYGINEHPFEIYGVIKAQEGHVRMPREVAKNVSAGIAQDYANTAGGRVRFVTDSPYVAVSAELSSIYQFSSMSIMGTCGIDVYVDGEFGGIVRPDVTNPDTHITDIVNMRERGEHIVEVNFPLYTGVKELFIGVDEGAAIKPAPKYTYDKPIVFYGSSITNGACASRPGLSYPARISRMLDTNYINLGFGGLCKAEQAMTDYIAGLDMSIFVLDYDYNAPDADYLEKTHENAYLTVRERNPDLPIVMISCPRADLRGAWGKRLEIIRRTYDNAIAKGDKNVYMINGSEFFREIGYDYAADGVHPTDLGFDLMAKGIAPILQGILKK